MIRLGTFILWLMSFLPFAALVAIGRAVGALGYILGRSRRHIANINLQLCFPQMPEAEREELVRQNFLMFGRSFVERVILWWWSAKRIERLIQVRGLEHFELSRTQPIILLTPHFVGLDVAGQWVSMHIKAVTMYSLQSNQYLNKFMLQKRGRFNSDQRIYSRQDGLRPIIKDMKDNRPFFYLPDQDQGVRDGAFIPFFGVLTATVTSVSRIAKITGAKVVPTIIQMLPGSEGYRLTFYPPWENYPSGDEIIDGRRMNEFIEQRVLDMPEQYFWLHKRFKTRPGGEKNVYT